MTLSDPSLSISLLASLVVNEELLAYQFAFDLVVGGSQDFLETVRSELPDGDEVSSCLFILLPDFQHHRTRKQKISMTNSERS